MKKKTKKKKVAEVHFYVRKRTWVAPHTRKARKTRQTRKRK